MIQISRMSAIRVLYLVAFLTTVLCIVVCATIHFEQSNGNNKVLDKNAAMIEVYFDRDMVASVVATPGEIVQFGEYQIVFYLKK